MAGDQRIDPRQASFFTRPDYYEVLARLRADDPQRAAYEVYAWLGAVQESLVQALA